MQEIQLMKRLDAKTRKTKKGKACNVVTYEALVGGDIIKVDVWDWNSETAEGQRWTAEVKHSDKYNSSVFLGDLLGNGGGEESRYEPIEEETPTKRQFNKAHELAEKELHSATKGTQPARYVPMDDYQIYEKACRLATDLCDGLHNLPDEETIEKWILFYYNQLVKHARGE